LVAIKPMVCSTATRRPTFGWALGAPIGSGFRYAKLEDGALLCFLRQSPNFGETSVAEFAYVNRNFTVRLIDIKKLTIFAHLVDICYSILLREPEWAVLCHELIIE